MKTKRRVRRCTRKSDGVSRLNRDAMERRKGPVWVNNDGRRFVTCFPLVQSPNSNLRCAKTRMSPFSDAHHDG